MCSHLETAYKTEPWKANYNLSQSKKARDQSLLLPIFNDLDYEDQTYICDKLKYIIKSLL